MRSQPINKASFKVFLLHTAEGPKKVFHNLPDIAGHRITDAVTEWMAVTKSRTALSLVNFIDNVGLNYTAFTEEQFAKL